MPTKKSPKKRPTLPNPNPEELEGSGAALTLVNQHDEATQHNQNSNATSELEVVMNEVQRLRAKDRKLEQENEARMKKIEEETAIYEAKRELQMLQEEIKS